MAEWILRTQLSTGSVVVRPLSELAGLAAEAGATYTIVDARTQEAPDGLVLARRDEDLEIELDGETLVVIDEFYAPDSTAQFSADGTFTQPAELGELPAVSAVGSLEAADVSAGILPTGASLLNPSTWGWAGIAGAAGAAGAAGLGAGLGVGLSGDDDSGPDTSVVVFDLAADGDSSDHSGQMFQPDVSYTIYVLVNSSSGLVDLDPAEQWSGVSNLGTDDVIVLVGTGSPVLVGASTPVASLSASGSQIWWYGSEAGIYVTAGGSLFRFETTSLSTTESTRFTTTLTAYTANLWDTETSWGTNPDADDTFSQAYLTTLPAGVLTSQGLA